MGSKTRGVSKVEWIGAGTMEGVRTTARMLCLLSNTRDVNKGEWIGGNGKNTALPPASPSSSSWKRWTHPTSVLERKALITIFLDSLAGGGSATVTTGGFRYPLPLCATSTLRPRPVCVSCANPSAVTPYFASGGSNVTVGAPYPGAYPLPLAMMSTAVTVEFSISARVVVMRDVGCTSEASVKRRLAHTQRTRHAHSPNSAHSVNSVNKWPDDKPPQYILERTPRRVTSHTGSRPGSGTA